MLVRSAPVYTSSPCEQPLDVGASPTRRPRRRRSGSHRWSCRRSRPGSRRAKSARSAAPSPSSWRPHTAAAPPAASCRPISSPAVVMIRSRRPGSACRAASSTCQHALPLGDEHVDELRGRGHRHRRRAPPPSRPTTERSRRPWPRPAPHLEWLGRRSRPVRRRAPSPPWCWRRRHRVRSPGPGAVATRAPPHCSSSVMSRADDEDRAGARSQGRDRRARPRRAARRVRAAAHSARRGLRARPGRAGAVRGLPDRRPVCRRSRRARRGAGGRGDAGGAWRRVAQPWVDAGATTPERAAALARAGVARNVVGTESLEPGARAARCSPSRRRRWCSASTCARES